MRSRVLALAASVVVLSGCPNEKPLVTSYSVGGTVSGLLGGGLVLQNNLSDTVEVNANGTFAFPTKLSKWTNYEVTVKDQPTMPAQTCTVENGAGTVTAEVTDVKVACATASYAVGGVVSGLVGAGLVLQDDESGAELPVAASATTYAFHFASGARYSLSVKTQPIKPAQTCRVFNPAGTVGEADIGDIPVTCTTEKFQVGGSIVGLAGTGLVVESGSGAEVAVDKAAQAYSFELESGTAYSIRIKAQPSSPQQTCVVANAAGTVDNAKIDDATITCTTDAFSVGGTISGLAGSGLTLTNNGGSDLVVASDQTTYAFVLPNGSAYDVQVKTQPTSPRQTCLVSNGTGTVGAANVSNVAVTCVTDAYALGGPIAGLVGAGLVLQNNGKDDLAVAANSTTYQFLVQSGATYALTVRTQPANPSQTCAISNATGTMTAAPITNASIACATNTYTVGGAITGLAGTGLVLQNNLSGDLAIAKGATGYAFPGVPSGSNYSVTIKSQPTGPEQTCVVSNATGKVGAANVSGVNIACTTKTYSVGGPVTGLAGDGLVLQDGYGHEVQVAKADIAYHFTLDSGALYAITVKTQPSNPRQNCIVKDGAGTVLSSNVTNASVECTTNAYSVGGAVTGLEGSGLVLQNGVGNDLPLAASQGSYAFSVVSGATYDIKVKTQPTDPTQTCAVANGTGTVGTSNVTNVNVSCTTNSYAVGGTITGYAGQGLELTNNGGSAQVIAKGATSYSFAVASGDTYLIAVKTQPNTPTQKCIVASPSGVVGGAAITSANITCDTNKFLVGGKITGLKGTGLILMNGTGNELPIAFDQTSYSFFVSSGASYTITVKTDPSGPSQSCTVANPTGTVSGADVTNVDVTCTTRSFTVGGAINGYDGSGLALLNNGGSGQTLAKGAKSYSFTVLSGEPYAISVQTPPSNPWQTCLVANDTGTMGGANVNTATITCTTNRYDVGGDVAGLEGTGLEIKEGVGNTTQTVATAAKSYAFSLLSGASYSLSVSKQPISPSQTCAVASPTGTVAGIDVTTAKVTCATDLFSLGGKVSGLVGPSTVALKNGGETLNVGNGNFTFANKVLSGAGYAVTAVAPANHACVVTNGSGTMGGGDVSNVQVACTWNTVIVLAASAGTSNHLAAAYQDGGAWVTRRIPGVAPAPIGEGPLGGASALAVTGSGVGIGLVRASDDKLRFTTWDGSTWTDLADTGPDNWTRAQPSLDTAAGRADAQAVFHGQDWKHYFLAYSLGWTASATAVGSPQAFGPNPPFILASGANATAAFIRDGGAGISTIDRVAAAWQPQATISTESCEASNHFVNPVLVAPASGADAMLIWHGAADSSKGSRLRFATHSSSGWSTAADVTDAWTEEPISAAALPNGDVILAFKRSDINHGSPESQLLNTSVYQAASKSWTSPRQAGLVHTLRGGPGIARGVGNAVAEVVWVGRDKYAYHCRILDSSGTCNSPNRIDPNVAGVDYISIATVP